MLCQLCDTAIKTGPSRLRDQKRCSWKWAEQQIHANLFSLQSSVNIGCLICRGFWDYYCEKNPRMRDVTGQVELARFDWSRYSHCVVYLSFEDHDEYFAVKIAGVLTGAVRFLLSPSCLDIKGSLITHPTPPFSTRNSMDLWKEWYITCQTHHKGCQALGVSNGFKPKRLVEICRDEPKYWNLIDETSSITDPYATLSHCWGSSQHQKLERKNIAIFKERGRNLIAELPQTFIDAIEVAKSMEIYYIWVDCLCIIQDDDIDWKEESSKMGSVYARATCNLAASCSTESSGGLFRTRDLALVQPTSVDFGYKLRGFSTYEISNAASYDNDVANAPLNARAWVAQERYLALRQLSFTANQVYWECPELVANEQCPKGLPNGLWNSLHTRSLRKRGMVPMSEANFRDTWSKMIEHYSSCDLTRKTDKLIALSGLGTQLQLVQSQHHQSQPPNTYIHGLWSHDIHQQLCWTRYGAKEERDDPPADEDIVPPTRLSGSIAPSWSWASLDGKVKYDLAHSDLGKQYRSSWIRVENFEVEEGETPAISKVLTLRGIALFGTLRPPYPKNIGTFTFSHNLNTPGFDKEPPGRGPSISRLRSILVGEVCWDLPQWPSGLDSSPELCFLMIYIDHVDETNHGLILQQISSPEEPVEYVRLGTFKHEGACDGDPGEPTDRSYFMQHIAARQGRKPPIESVDYEAVDEVEYGMKHECHLDATSETSVFQRAERTRWIMNLDRPSMRDLVHTIRIR